MVELKSRKFFTGGIRRPESRRFDFGDVPGTVLKYLAGSFASDDPQDRSRGRPVWETWDRARYPWNVHLSLNIDQALLRMWRRYGVNPEEGSGRLSDDLRALRQARIEWNDEHHRSASVDELARATSLSRNRVVHLLEVDAQTATRNLHDLLDYVAANTATPESDTLFDEVWTAIQELPDDDRQLIQRRWIDMESPDSIAEDLGVTRRTVDRRIRTALNAAAASWSAKFAVE